MGTFDAIVHPRCRLALLVLLTAGASLVGSAAQANVFVFPSVAAPADPRLPGGDNREYVDIVITVPGKPAAHVKALVDPGFTGGNGMMISPALAASLGITGGTAGSGAGSGGHSAPGSVQKDVAMPAGSAATIDGAATPTGQTATNTSLPTTVTVYDNSGATKAPVTIGQDFLKQFGSKGVTKGTKGSFYFLIAADQNNKTGLAKVGELTNDNAPPAGPDGRPPGLHVAPISSTPPPDPAPDPGTISFDGGDNISVAISDATTGDNAAGSFIIKPGSTGTLISEDLAASLGIDTSGLPLETVLDNFSPLLVPTTTLNLALFPGSTFGDFSLPVGILSDSQNPFGENILGSDVLSQFGYYEIDDADGLFYAGPVPEPQAAVLLGAGAAGLIAARRRRVR
jgi:hypothetical protein